MRVALKDLNLKHLWVVYPSALHYKLDDKIIVLSLREITSIFLNKKCFLQ